MDFLNSNTRKHIKTALDVESIAIIRYFIYADMARKEGRVEIANLFEKMAKNEIEHAKVWFKHLYHVETDGKKHLEESAHNENSEWKNMYPQFAKEAKAEGFLEIAALFERISSIECDHERRFLEQILMKETATKEHKQETAQKYFCIFCGFGAEEQLCICPFCEAENSFE